MLEWLDAECEAAIARVMRSVDRKIHFEARSKGQKARFARVRASVPTYTLRPGEFIVGGGGGGCNWPKLPDDYRIGSYLRVGVDGSIEVLPWDRVLKEPSQ